MASKILLRQHILEFIKNTPVLYFEHCPPSIPQNIPERRHFASI